MGPPIIYEKVINKIDVNKKENVSHENNSRILSNTFSEISLGQFLL